MIFDLSTLSVDNLKKTRYFFVLTLTISSPIHASGVNSSLNHFFNDLGYHTNVSNPSSYKGQTANYYNGGSLFVRTPIKQAQLASVTVPSVSMGCGGIDAFMGGFSHINSDQLVQFGQSVVSSAVPFAIDLALQTWAPQIKQIRDNLQSIADKWLNQSINSCETAQAAVGGLAAFAAPQAQKHVCATIGTHNNAFSDWVAAQQECGVGGQSSAQLVNARNSAELEDIAKVNHNIVWSAILNNTFLSSDKTLAEFLMSLSGTYLYDSQSKPRYYPSLLTDNNNVVNALLEGGDVDVYRCDDRDKKACLSPTITTVTLSPNNALKENIITLIDALYLALANDTRLSASQESFLEYTTIPILGLLRDAIAENVTPPISDYAEVIAVDLLSRYLSNMLNVTEYSLSNTQVDSKDIALITKDIAKARTFTQGLATEAQARILANTQWLAVQKQKRQVFMSAIDEKTQQHLNFGEAM